MYSEQQDFLWVYEAQLERWQQENLTAAQQQQVAQLKPDLSEILEIAEEFKGKTIESVLGKSDAELASDILSGRTNLPI